MARFRLLLFLALSTICFAKEPQFDNIFDWLFRDGGKWPQLLSSLSVASSIGTTLGQFSLKPPAGSSWNIELINVPKPAQAADDGFHIWDYDMEDASKSVIDAFHAKGHPVICYFSAGSWENWRKDADQFPKDALGKALSGWPGERWIDTRNADVRALMEKRIKEAAGKGCDGVDPDNVDGYENDTGFDLTKDDGVNYVKFLAKSAHDVGLSFGLKNGGAIVERVIDVAQWSINEECVMYNECELYQPFIKDNKPVFHVEYTEKDPAPSEFVKEACRNSKAKGFSTIIKHLNLSAWTTTCP